MKSDLAIGLAWTEVGGQVLLTEATIMEGKGRLHFHRQARRRHAGIRASWNELYPFAHGDYSGLAKDFYRHIDIHVHVPEGAIPKDGPSAGITIATAIVSAVTRIPARCDMAMTGEITLRGKVLPIGGLKEKMMAAHRVGIAHLIIPKENERDLADVPAEILAVMEVKSRRKYGRSAAVRSRAALAFVPSSGCSGGCRGIRAAGKGRPEFDQLKVPCRKQKWNGGWNARVSSCILVRPYEHSAGSRFARA